jgi:choline dehydrogenase
VIQPNYLSARRDQETIVSGLKIGRSILRTAPISALIDSEYLPGKHVKSDDELLGYARQCGTTVFHPTSSCRMGTDALAVVDPRLRVRKVSGLRVVDASIMPSIPSGNTNAPTIMIGEKAADMISHWLRPYAVFAPARAVIPSRGGRGMDMILDIVD